MAGIGFELNKMFSKKGIFAKVSAYAYAGVITAGPTLLGIMMLLGLRVIGSYFNATEDELELLNGIVTYTLLLSLVLSNVFSLASTRYIADALYQNHKERVMPAFWGTTVTMLCIGTPLYLIFLLLSHVDLFYIFLAIVFFGELALVWTQMSLLSALKDYQSILKWFAISIMTSWVVGIVLIELHAPIVATLLFSVCVAYGIMAFSYQRLLLRYFPEGMTTSMDVMRGWDRHPYLVITGIMMSIGLYGHIIIMWHSQLQQTVCGFIVCAPKYDIPSLLAFLTILVTLIRFVTSIEVNFYSRYRNYFGLLNEGGSLRDILQAEKEMRMVLINELSSTFTVQVFFTILMIVFGSLLLPSLPLGMDDDMLGIFRVLSIAYTFYSMGNCMVLLQLYFSDEKGAMISTSIFAGVTVVVSLITCFMDVRFTGMGFLLGSFAFTIASFVILRKYLNHLLYKVLRSQPVVVIERQSWITKKADAFRESFYKKYPEVAAEAKLRGDED